MVLEPLSARPFPVASLFRRGGPGPVPAVEAVGEPRGGKVEAVARIAPAASRDGASPSTWSVPAADGLPAGAAPRPGTDPRSPWSILEPSRDEKGPGDREPAAELAELEAEKARGERKREDSAASRSMETIRVLGALRARDAEVRAHEAAHVGAGGRYVTGGASYSYQKGPDGRNYAVGGEVGIDSSPVPGKPEETIAKMRAVRAAALAPAEPSGADLAVAGAAAQAEAQAMAELRQARSEARPEASASGAAAYAAEARAGGPAAPYGDSPPELGLFA